MVLVQNAIRDSLNNKQYLQNDILIYVNAYIYACINVYIYTRIHAWSKENMELLSFP
jgi:hypothetical protein